MSDIKVTDELSHKLNKIKLLVMDVDGTLTDGTMYYSKTGEELKKFSTRDGMGITLLRKNDIESAIITSEYSQISEQRAIKLRIEHVVLGSRNKTESLIELSKKLNLELNEIAFIGDDINDEHVMNIAGVSACPADATKSIQQIADYICSSNGGNGAVREFIEAILKSQNKSICLTENW
jgi:YrbI family 3-deoxy-D-manno-octulosonate 8-phosphate phosphatase